MKDLYKPTLGSLSQTEDRNLRSGIDYRFGMDETLEEVKKTELRLRNFVDELESFSFITPNERRYYMGYISNAEEQREEELR